MDDADRRRISVLEKRLDRLLDAEKGIYAKIMGIEGKLKGYAITILSSIVVSLVIQIGTR